MARHLSCKMAELPQLWDRFDGKKFFCVGSGKSRYDLWTVGPSGLHYVYRTNWDGLAVGRRAVEPTKVVHLYVEEEETARDPLREALDDMTPVPTTLDQSLVPDTLLTT